MPPRAGSSSISDAPKPEPDVHFVLIGSQATPLEGRTEAAASGVTIGPESTFWSQQILAVEHVKNCPKSAIFRHTFRLKKTAFSELPEIDCHRSPRVQLKTDVNASDCKTIVGWHLCQLWQSDAPEMPFPGAIGIES